MEPTFSTPGDAMESGWTGTRTKFIHSVGATAACKFVPKGNSGYTGIFAGANHGYIRLSSAARPTSSQPLAPGMGLKFLRDGADSANLLAMFSVEGQPDDWNFFSNDFTNHIEAATGKATKALAKKFATATRWIQAIGLKDWGTMGENGQTVSSPNYPHNLRFQPTTAVHNLFSKNLDGEDYMKYVD